MNDITNNHNTQEQTTQIMQLKTMSGEVVFESSEADSYGRLLQLAHQQKIDLKNLDLRDTDIIGVDLSGADLSGSNFENARIGECNFYDVKFDNAVLRCNMYSSTFEKIEFNDVKLDWILLDGIDFRKVNFNDSDLSRTCFADTNFEDVVFNRSDLSKTNFFTYESSTFKDCVLINTSLDDANFGFGDDDPWDYLTGITVQPPEPEMVM